MFTHPSKTLQKGEGTHALYEGEYYLVETVAVGQPLEQGNIVRTAPGGKARVIFANGDQLNVGPATAMRIFWDKDARDSKTRIDLAYGKVRGIVEKGGPRSKLQIRTRTATMGVRGTDFFIADGGVDGGTEVSIMRGAVEVTPKAKDSKPVEVKQGFSAEVVAPKPPSSPEATASSPSASAAPAAPAVELRKTTQEELQGIQRSSTIVKKEGEAPKEAPAAVAQLEKKAVETALKDIKTYDPQLYAQLESKKPASTDEINGAVVQERIKEAPHAPAQHKPYKSEVDDLDQGAYEKYFKQE